MKFGYRNLIKKCWKDLIMESVMTFTTKEDKESLVKIRLIKTSFIR